MGSTNYGNQEITFDYLQEATSTGFNKLLVNLLQPGIYAGLAGSIVDNANVSVTAGDAFILDGTQPDPLSLGIHMTTVDPVNISCSPSTPYLIMRLEWLDVINNYVDFLSAAYADVRATDLIIGVAIYSGATLTSIDTTLRSVAYAAGGVGGESTGTDKFKVYPTSPVASNQVQIKTGGMFQNGSALINVPSSSLSPTISSVAAGMYRNDIVWIAEDGTLSVTEGTPDASTPVTPIYNNKYVVAEIHRGPSSTIVTGSDIVDTRTPDRANTFPNGLALGIYADEAPPDGGLVVSGQTGLGTNSPTAGKILHALGDSKFEGDLEITGNATIPTIAGNSEVTGTLTTNDQTVNGTISIDGVLIIPVVTSDPASPVVGQMWYRSDL